MASRNLCQCSAGLPYVTAGFGALDGEVELTQRPAHSALQEMRAIEVFGELLLRDPAIAIFGFPGIAGTFAYSDHPTLAQQAAAVTGIAEGFAAVLGPGPVEVFHNGGELRLQAEEVAQLLGAGFQ